MTAERLQRVAAYGVVTDGDGRLLLVRLSDQTGSPGRWTLPGGGLEFGEHPEDALVREVREETGLEVRSWELLDVLDVRAGPGDGGPEDVHAIQLVYRVVVADPSATVVHEADGSTDRAEWFSRDAAVELPSGRLVSRVLERLSTAEPLPGPDGPRASYNDTSSWDRRDVVSGGSRMVPVETPSGTFRVWTRRVGTNPDLKVLLLHGGPGATDELYECFDTWFPRAGIEYYYYDQLGSFRSDQPDDPSLWDLDRFVDEVEQVRRALGLDRDNFVLLGQSWGGLLAMEYAVHHQQHLKGLVVSNMMSSARLYNAYATDVLMPAMDQEVLAEIKRFEAEGRTDDPRYEQLLTEHHYVLHVCRMPYEDWPDPVRRSLAHINPDIYVPMQGPSELGLSGTLESWDRSGDLQDIDVPALVIGATHDTMDPEHMRWMAEQLPQGHYLHCPDGSHLAQFDDPDHYFPGLVDFLLSL